MLPELFLFLYLYHVEPFYYVMFRIFTEIIIIRIIILILVIA